MFTRLVLDTRAQLGGAAIAIDGNVSLSTKGTCRSAGYTWALDAQKEELMSPAIRIVGVVLCLVLVVLASSQPDAAPKFSDWAVPTNLGPTVNSPFNDFGAAISKDGLTLYFNSNRPGARILQGCPAHHDAPH